MVICCDCKEKRGKVKGEKGKDRSGSIGLIGSIGWREIRRQKE
jgi:hypothetical protein